MKATAQAVRAVDTLEIAERAQVARGLGRREWAASICRAEREAYEAQGVDAATLADECAEAEVPVEAFPLIEGETVAELWERIETYIDTRSARRRRVRIEVEFDVTVPEGDEDTEAWRIADEGAARVFEVVSPLNCGGGEDIEMFVDVDLV